MKINALQTIDFQGLSGKREYPLGQKITVLAAPNGSGKTSFINAVRFGLTGEMPKAVSCTKGAKKADVGIVLEDGTSWIREIPIKGPSKQWLNRKQISKTALQEQITAMTGVNQNSMNIATASDIIANMKPQELSNFMLSFIPQTLNREEVAEYMNETIDDKMEKVLEKYLPDGTFGIHTVDNAYAKAFDDRRNLKRKAQELSGAIEAMSGAEKPAESKEELQKRKKALEALRQAWTEYRTKLAAYKNAESAAAKNKELIEKLEKALAANTATHGDPQVRKALVEQLEKNEASLADINRIVTTLRSNVLTMRKALATLDKPVCPLSEKLRCTTDKSPIRNELEEEIKATETTGKAQSERAKVLSESIAELKKDIEAFDKNEQEAAKRDSWVERLNQAKSAQTMLPKNPEAPKEAFTEDMIREIDKKLFYFESEEKLEAYKKSFEKVSENVQYLERFVNAMAPKGVVKNQIVSAYLNAFEDECNIKAEELKPGMRIKFDSDKGIIPMLDVYGTGVYLPYEALSGGEKIYMIFLLLDMCNAMCGLRIMILDELSVLDPENFKSLIQMLVKHTDEYDQIILGMVDHDDMLEVLKKEGIPLISI